MELSASPYGNDEEGREVFSPRHHCVAGFTLGKWEPVETHCS